MKVRKELGIAVLVHRDRDFLSDSDRVAVCKKMEYDIHQVPFWMPTGSDIEAEFCRPEHLERVFDIDSSDAIALVNEAVELIDEEAAERDFNTAYLAAVGGLDKTEVGVPSKRWRELGGFCTETIKGKQLLSSIEKAAQARYIGTADVTKLKGLKMISNPAISMQPELKKLIETAIRDQKLAPATT